jgi:hypothetical protein
MALFLKLLLLSSTWAASDCPNRLKEAEKLVLPAPVKVMAELHKNLPRSCRQPNCMNVSAEACVKALEIHSVYQDTTTQAALRQVYSENQSAQLADINSRYGQAIRGFTAIDASLKSAIEFLVKGKKVVEIEDAKKVLQFTQEAMESFQRHNENRLKAAQVNRGALERSERELASLSGELSAVPGFKPSDLPQLREGVSALQTKVDALSADPGIGTAQDLVRSTRSFCQAQVGTAISASINKNCLELNKSDYTCTGFSALSTECHAAAIRQSALTMSLPFMLATGSSRMNPGLITKATKAIKKESKIRKLASSTNSKVALRFAKVDQVNSSSPAALTEQKKKNSSVLDPAPALASAESSSGGVAFAPQALLRSAMGGQPGIASEDLPPVARIESQSQSAHLAQNVESIFTQVHRCHERALKSGLVSLP